ncbi:DUF5694 domain-containing protein [Pontibacter harenae]|uniref:DUF5694 domain-containing protein n=1 Tax=Pontibacter harenae TaxID=2894083 RepID=UPI001E3C80E5|nr:DUF5694 domain-containing protein [Pontibacter harenae]MCC9168994.1 DUF5694 domain-containing protein [Pontibacter harenae]
MRLFLAFLIFGFCLNVSAQSGKTEILLLGSDHLRNVYKEGYPNTDVLTDKNQKNIRAFSSLVERYSPDMVMIEVVPERQQEIDSLYSLYLENKLKLNSLEDGRDEIYQLAFRIGKNSGVQEIICVNSKGGTSKSILDNGENIEIFQNEDKELGKVVSEKYAALQNGKLSFKDFLVFLNQPKTYNMVYRFRYMTPARVTNGTFTNPDEMVDTAFINPKYIGAELISVFKNRDYKIYSNIVTNHLRKKPKRILVIIGVGHIGSLKSIFRDDEEFAVVDANKFLMKKTVHNNE